LVFSTTTIEARHDPSSGGSYLPRSSSPTAIGSRSRRNTLKPSRGFGADTFELGVRVHTETAITIDTQLQSIGTVGGVGEEQGADGRLKGKEPCGGGDT